MLVNGFALLRVMAIRPEPAAFAGVSCNVPSRAFPWLSLRALKHGNYCRHFPRKRVCKLLPSNWSPNLGTGGGATLNVRRYGYTMQMESLIRVAFRRRDIGSSHPRWPRGIFSRTRGEARIRMRWVLATERSAHSLRVLLHRSFQK